MKNLFKKVLMGVLAVALVITSGITLTACKENPENQILSLSVNPGVEFIVDEDDKVVSVSASNEDGAYLLQKFTEFTGMSAKDAALKFLELSEQYGFVVKGAIDEESFTISVSGEGAEDLYKDVKRKISSKAEDLGLSIANMVEISEDAMEAMVAECYQEYSASYIDDLDEEQLIDLIKQSREETKALFTDDERQAYYRDRAQEVLKAKIDAVNNYLSENPSLTNAMLTPLVTVMNTAYSTLESAYATINSTIENLYTNATTGINAKLDTYISEKEEYLSAVEAYREAVENNAANIETLKNNMIALKGEAETTWNSLNSARTQAKQQLLTSIQSTIHAQVTALNNAIDSVLEHISLSMTEINNKVQTEINNLKTEYATASVNPWGQQ